MHIGRVARVPTASRIGDYELGYRAEQTDLPGVLVLTPRVFTDDRGFFYESYSDDALAEATGRPVRFVQDNHSRSDKGVLRGLHFQVAPHPQAKLVRCTRGAIWDVVVDVRRDSSTLGKWFAVDLSEENLRQIWVPVGFAHGFVAMTDGADVQYKTTDRYAPECERSILWNDPEIGVPWPIEIDPIISPKDAAAPTLSTAELMSVDRANV